MSNQLKKVTIFDRIPMQIYGEKYTNGPIIETYLSDEKIGKLLRARQAPRSIFAVKPGKRVLLTLDNYTKSVDELFGEIKKEEVKKPEPDVKKDEEVKSDPIKVDEQKNDEPIAETMVDKIEEPTKVEEPVQKEVKISDEVEIIDDDEEIDVVEPSAPKTPRKPKRSSTKPVEDGE